MEKGGFIMSKRILGIFLSVFALFITAALTFWYFGKNTSDPSEEQRGTEFVEMLPTEISPERYPLPAGLWRGRRPKRIRMN